MSSTTKTSTTEHTFEKDDLLMREGEPSGDLWIIRSGMVEVFRERRGRRVPLAVLEAGEMLGTMTATNGSPRSASVRALSSGTATVISSELVNKLVNSLPPWAMSLIKDLIGRIHYANELYIDVESNRGRLPPEHPLSFVRKFLKTFIALADAIAVEKNGTLFVPVDGRLNVLGQALGDPDETSIMMDILFRQKLITNIKHVGEGRHVRLDAVTNLSLFADIIERLANDGDHHIPFAMPFAINERKMLAELAELGITKAGNSDTATLHLNVVVEELRKQDIEIENETLARASKYGLIVVDKTCDDPTISFDTHLLEFAMKCFNAIKEITDPKTGRTRVYRKTLLY